MQYIFINEKQLKDLEKANATGGSAILDLEYDIDKHCNKIVEHREEIKFVTQVTTVTTEDRMEAEDKIYYTGRIVGKDGNSIIVKDVMIGRDGPPPKKEPLKSFGDVLKQESKEEELEEEKMEFCLTIRAFVFKVESATDYNLNNRTSKWTSTQLLWGQTLRDVFIGENVKITRTYKGVKESIETIVKAIDREKGTITVEEIIENVKEAGKKEMGRAKIKNLCGEKEFKIEIPPKEAVNHPSHYQLGDLGIEALDVMEATMTNEQLKGFYIGNVQKYTLRAAEKNGPEDFKKALFYLNKLVELMESE